MYAWPYRHTNREREREIEKDTHIVRVKAQIFGEWHSLTRFTLNMTQTTKFRTFHKKKQSISKYIDYTVLLNSTEAQPGIYSTHLVS